MEVGEVWEALGEHSVGWEQRAAVYRHQRLRISGARPCKGGGCSQGVGMWGCGYEGAELPM